MKTMLSHSLMRARERAGIGTHLLAALSAVPEDAIRAWESGRSEPTPVEADSVARVFGVRLKDIDAPGGWPLERLLFRSCETQAVATLADSGAFRTIGEFLRAIADLVELDPNYAARSPLRLPTFDRSSLPTSPWLAGESLAREARKACQLGATAPIPVMSALLEQLGVRVLYTTPSELDPAIDGVSTRIPSPAILVNLLEGPESWWRTRMTLAHELCHLLVDHSADPSADEAFVSASTASPAYALYEGHAAIEARANAFAACLLAPSEAVQALLSTGDPTSEDAVVTVAKHFGMGRTAAVNRIRDVFGFSAATRDRMRSRVPGKWTSDSTGDIARGVGIRGGVVRDITLRALAQGDIDPLRARELLGISLSEPLPAVPGVDPALLRPLRDPGDRARSVAQRHVTDVMNRADLVALPAQRTAHGWLVPLENESSCVRVSFDMNVEP